MLETENPETLRIRIGNPNDLDEIMSIAMEACEENAFLPPNPVRLLNDIWPALNRDRGLVGIIGQPSGAAEGAILLRIGHLWYSDVESVEEKAVFIKPEFRSAKGGRARKLCEFGKKVADELNMPLVIGVLSSSRTAGKIRMYERIFGEPSGAFFLYGAKTGEWKNSSKD